MNVQGKYADLGRLKMYYELHGQGRPLVLLHGGGSTIGSSFGFILPELAKSHRVIAVELQAHGNTLDTGQPLSFEQDADDVADLMQLLAMDRADFLGFSNGGTTCLQMAIRHPSLVNKLILASALFKRSGTVSGFFEGFGQASLEHMPEPLKKAYLEANPNPQGLQTMFERDVERMKAFRNIPDKDIRGISQAALVINGDREVVLAEHAMELAKLLPNGRLAIFPCGHGEYIGEICSTLGENTIPRLVLAFIEDFLCD